MIISGLISLAYLIVLGRLWNEQIQNGELRGNEVRKQTIRRIRRPSVRGRIISSDGVVLADNAPKFEVVFEIAAMRQPGYSSRTIKHILRSAGRIAEVIQRENPLTKRKIQEHINYKPAIPLTVFGNLSIIELARVSEIVPPIRGMEIVTIPRRRYPWGSTAAHVIGYIRTDDPRNATDRDEYFYYIPDKRGVKGVEKAFDTEIVQRDVRIRGLRGTPGNSLVKVDFRGYVHTTIGTPRQGSRGHDIVLTLDFKAQRIAEKLMKGGKGAMIMLDADTGAVLLTLSFPEYDISKFVPRLSGKYWKELISDSGSPLLNRALNGRYEPGSIIKPLVALALLRNGMPVEETVSCQGRAYIGKTSIRCWNWRSGGHGLVNVVSALEQSCNVFFIEEGRILGMEKISQTFAELGVGEKPVFPLPCSKGLLPSREEKFRRTGRKWNVFDTALISIGQGEVNLSPLQAALYIAAIANGGTLYHPHILEKALDAKGNTVFVRKTEVKRKIKIPQAMFDTVREGMREVVHGDHGSAKQANSSKIYLYGKTGTAEVRRGGAKKKNTWFACFGVHGKKTYALIVFVEDGESGGKTCAPIAKAFFDAWLPDKQK